MNKRLKVCMKCAHRNVGICTKCGCFIHAKTLIPTAKCPIGLW